MNIWITWVDTGWNWRDVNYPSRDNKWGFDEIIRRNESSRIRSEFGNMSFSKFLAFFGSVWREIVLNEMVIRIWARAPIQFLAQAKFLFVTQKITSTSNWFLKCHWLNVWAWLDTKSIFSTFKTPKNCKKTRIFFRKKMCNIWIMLLSWNDKHLS